MDLITPTLAQLPILVATYNKGLKLRPNNRWDTNNSDLKLTLTKLSHSWQQADFCQARVTIESLSEWLHNCTEPEIQHIVHLITGAHYCETGELDKAYRSFESSRYHLRLAQENRQTSSSAIEDESKRAFLSLKEAWCHILGSQVELARNLLVKKDKFPTDHLQGHRSVLMAIIGCIEADEASAEDHLLIAADKYRAKNDFAALAAIQLYQAKLYQNVGASQESRRHLEDSLYWLEQNNYSYLPYWWHSQIMPSLLTEAVELGCYPEQAKLMLTHYQNASASFNSRLAQPADEQSSNRQPRTTLTFPTSLYRDDIGIHASEKCQRALDELFHHIETGFLNEQRLPHLARKIPHGIKGRKLNPTILAVFCLHVQNISVSEIAHRLSVAVSTVKSYITKIYNAFELSINNFSRQADRHTLLVEKAINEGYLM